MESIKSTNKLKNSAYRAFFVSVVVTITVANAFSQKTKKAYIHFSTFNDPKSQNYDFMCPTNVKEPTFFISDIMCISMVWDEEKRRYYDPQYEQRYNRWLEQLEKYGGVPEWSSCNLNDYKDGGSFTTYEDYKTRTWETDYNMGKDMGKIVEIDMGAFRECTPN